MKTPLPESSADLSARGSFESGSLDRPATATLDASALTVLEISNPKAQIEREATIDQLEDQGCLGQALQQDGTEVTISAGGWLAAAIRTFDDLAANRPPVGGDQRRLLQRFSQQENGSIDLLIRGTEAGGDLHIQQRLPDIASRTIRHDLSNQVNSAKINAELVRVLANRSGDDRLVSAAERILEDCAKASTYQRLELPALIAQSPRSYPAVTSIEELVSVVAGADKAQQKTTLKMQLPENAQLPASWLSCVGSFLQRIALSLTSPPAVSHEPNLIENGISLLLETKSDKPAENKSRLIALFDAEWARGRDLHGSLCALSPTAGPFSLLVEPGSLHFRGGAS